MCLMCELQKIPVGAFRFPVALPARPQDTLTERVEALEDVMNQLIGDDQ